MGRVGDVALVLAPCSLPHWNHRSTPDNIWGWIPSGPKQGSRAGGHLLQVELSPQFKVEHQQADKAHTLHTWNQSLDHAPLYMRLILNLVRIRQGVSGSQAGGRVMSNLDTGHLICLLLLQRPCCPMATRKLTGLADHDGSVVSRRIRGSKGPLRTWCHIHTWGPILAARASTRTPR
ncbi:hypothetical protein BR93DRAFT_617129 [Coniochaeta sp. PMI_546]|nr:hypothetical protein BR93DRAFT_617129 [Coniochaeta sp. PMI_546]